MRNVDAPRRSSHAGATSRARQRVAAVLMRSCDLVVPVLNEKDHIERLLAEIDAMAHVSLDVTVIVIEGGSTDGTRSVLERVLPSYPRVSVMENPGGNKARGLNAAIDSTRGDVVVRLDAHASYPPHYLTSLVRALDEHGADAVGGVRVNATGTGVISRAIAAVNGSRFGVGNATYRTGAAEPREVDTVFPGFWRRDVFERLGGFDVELERAQDREFSARLKRSGGRIMLIPSVTITYFGRDRLSSNLKWTADGANWVMRAARGRRGVLKIRNIIPLAFFVSLLISASVIARTSGLVRIAALAPAGAYTSLALFEGLRASLRRRHPALLLVMPPLYLMTHAAYAWGSLIGLVSRARPSARRASRVDVEGAG